MSEPKDATYKEDIPNKENIGMKQGISNESLFSLCSSLSSSDSFSRSYDSLSELKKMKDYEENFIDINKCIDKKNLQDSDIKVRSKSFDFKIEFKKNNFLSIDDQNLGKTIRRKREVYLEDSISKSPQIKDALRLMKNIRLTPSPQLSVKSVKSESSLCDLK